MYLAVVAHCHYGAECVKDWRGVVLMGCSTWEVSRVSDKVWLWGLTIPSVSERARVSA